MLWFCYIIQQAISPGRGVGATVKFMVFLPVILTGITILSKAQWAFIDFRSRLSNYYCTVNTSLSPNILWHTIVNNTLNYITYYNHNFTTASTPLYCPSYSLLSCIVLRPNSQRTYRLLRMVVSVASDASGDHTPFVVMVQKNIFILGILYWTLSVWLRVLF